MVMDSHLQELAEKTVRYAGNRGTQYCDARAEQYTKRSARVDDGQTEFIKTDRNAGIGIRIIYDGAWGFCSITNPDSFDQVSEYVEGAIRDASHYSRNKKNPVRLAPITQSRARIEFPVQKRPSIEEMVEIAQDCDAAIREKPNIIKSSISPSYVESSKYFVSSEGSSILQDFTDVVIHMTATGHDSGLTQSVDITEGGRGGIEQITQNDAAYRSADSIAEKASQLPNAKPASKERATVVMNPDFVSLLTHEILGHPSEADRVLGREMAWAGGAWWSGKIGQKIGSENLSVFDDPTINESLGWYHFDDEGVKAEKTMLVKDGILKNHMQSRETAQVFGTKPTGNMRAASYNFMPLIRMACTCIAGGDHGTDEIIRGVKDGYLISNMKVPSIDMRRYNWSISCQYAQKIKDGQVTDLHRDVIVAGTAPEFFDSIDACGNDFTVRPITNCGKGDPMQSMIMGNGGPTIRGKAIVKSVS